ncbi:MAG: rhodanese-like domain-containing protein [Myxococcota bacterium]
MSCTPFEPDVHHRRLVANGALLLDVRSPSEFHEGHLPRAKNVPLSELRWRLHELGPTRRPVVVYCRSGNRSSQAAAMLCEAGFPVRDLGPISAW